MIVCRRCGKPVKSPRRVFCSQECYTASNNDHKPRKGYWKVPRACLLCDTAFTPKVHNQKYCCPKHSRRAHKLADKERKRERKAKKKRVKAGVKKPFGLHSSAPKVPLAKQHEEIRQLVVLARRGDEGARKRLNDEFEIIYERLS